MSRTQVAVPLVIAAVIASGVTGLGGFGAAWLLRGERTVEIPRAPTDAELEAACSPAVAAVNDELGAAQTKVAALEREKAVQERQVKDLEARIEKGAEAGQQLRAELARVKAELAETQEQLRIANEEKAQLLVELTQTQEELEATQVELVKTQGERDEAREDALFNRWQDFLHTSQLEICEKGSRKKLGNCRDDVMASLAADEARFAHCIRSGQAEPAVHELAKNAGLPQYAEMMNEDAKTLKGWYVEFCDPTLPEIDGAPLAEGRLPKAGEQG